MKRLFTVTATTILASSLIASTLSAADKQLLNTSYDVTREFYSKVNEKFAADYKAKTGDTVVVDQSHGGSSKQARAVVDGLEADVATFNQSTDIDILVKAGLVTPEWRKSFPHNASPYTSTILFLVRKGNPKNIKDWDDLAREGVQPIIPHPKTSGNGRYSYAGAWAFSLSKDKDENQAREFVKKIFANVPVLDAGGRGATNSFAQNNIGDVLLTFENEVHLTIRELGADKFDIVVPSTSIAADAPIAVVEKVAAKHGTSELAKAYLDYLFTDPVQEIAAENYFRPSNPEILKKYSDRFPSIPLVTVEDLFGGWEKAYEVHFKDGGVFDQIYGQGQK